MHHPDRIPDRTLDRIIHIVAIDPLARSALAAVIDRMPGWRASALLTPAEFSGESTTALPPADAILWDTGWNAQDTLPLLQTYLLTEANTPLLVLVEQSEHASILWQAGAAAILTRSVDAETLAATLEAVLLRLRVLGPEFTPASDESPVTPHPIVEPLTPRELDVLRLVAQGLPNKSIARELEISEHTVKFHMNALLGKLNAQSRTEAVVNASRAGVIQV